MNDIDVFEQRVKERLAVTDERRRLRQNHLEQRMQALEQRHQQFSALADRLMRQIICPRMRKLAEHFDNAEFPDAEPPDKHHCLCRLQHTDRFPATAHLELAVSHDGDYETVQVLYHLEILPVFFSYNGNDQLALPRDAVNEERVAAWVDDRLVEFVDAYLQVEVMDQYQSENLVIDPVCGMRVHKADATARFEHRGRTYYFCLEECRQKFAAAPQRYLTPGSGQT
jgi:YHS domain-containing protein